METWNRSSAALFFLVLIGFVAASFDSESVFHGSVRGRILKAKKSCPINFEFQNYTIITGYCKGPKYPPKACCKAFKNFACPFAKELNDLSNDCASTMFSYINLYGKYPPGLFAQACKAKNGLKCPKGEGPTSPFPQ